MKTALFTTSWLEGHDALGSNRVDRTLRYLNYYRALKEELGFEVFALFDNASDPTRIKLIEAPDVYVHRFETKLERLGPNEVPYCWRGIYMMNRLIHAGYEKIIMIETDAFILSSRMAHFIRELNSGWTSFWSPRFQFPACEINVLCKDAFPKFQTWIGDKTWEERSAQKNLFETSLPFDFCWKRFAGDRFGEFDVGMSADVKGWPQEPWMDYYTQAQLKTPLHYRKD